MSVIADLHQMLSRVLQQNYVHVKIYTNITYTQKYEVYEIVVHKCSLIFDMHEMYTLFFLFFLLLRQYVQCVTCQNIVLCSVILCLWTNLLEKYPHAPYLFVVWCDNAQSYCQFCCCFWGEGLGRGEALLFAPF